MSRYVPRSITQVGQSIQLNIVGNTPLLTNFTEYSLNRALIYSGMGSQLSEQEYLLKALELSAYVRYSGGPITEEDLAEMPMESNLRRQVDLNRLNRYMQDWHLDALVAQDGIERDPGDRAAGELTILIADSTQGLFEDLDEGTEIRTEPGYIARELLVSADVPEEYDTAPNADGSLSFYTTETLVEGSGVGQNSVSVPIEAEAVGPAYNVGAGAISVLTDNRRDISQVYNSTATTGGEPRETNQELRERAMGGPTFQSGGGTPSGIRGAFEDPYAPVLENLELSSGVDLTDFGDIDREDLKLLPVYDPTAGEYARPGELITGYETGGPTYPSDYSYVRVVIDAPNVTLPDLQEFLDEVHPSGKLHLAERPTEVVVGVTLSLRGDAAAIDTAAVESVVTRYISSLALGEDVLSGRIIQQAMNSDDDLEDVDPSLTRNGVAVADPPNDVAITDLERAVAGTVTATVTTDTGG